MSFAAFRNLAVAVVLLLSLPALADDAAVAREHNNKAMKAYALGRYAVAASEYELAFDAKPLPELLYNAAQAQRLAGNKKRALELYQNYLRVFGAHVTNGNEVELHIDQLKKAIEGDERATSSPPLAPVAIPTVNGLGGEGRPDLRPAGTATGTGAGTGATTAATVTLEPGPQQQVDTPLVKKGWFWGVMAGVAALVIAGVTVGALFAGGGASDPMPSFGSVKVF